MEKKEQQDNGVGLLDELANKTGCLYLSDLRNESYQIKCRKVLSQMKAEAYSPSVWKDAAYYFTKITCPFETAEEVRNWLLDHLKN